MYTQITVNNNNNNNALHSLICVYVRVCVTCLGLLHVPKVNQSASSANGRRSLNWQPFVASVVVAFVIAFVLPDFIILFNK